ncbi:MAG: hypothetical protein ABSF27_02090 [Candidatus Dormibacteria bacterium]
MARGQRGEGAEPASSALSPQLRERLSELGRPDWPGTGPGLDAGELWTQLFRRWGRRVGLIELYQLEAAARGVSIEGLGQDDRDRMAAHVLQAQFPGWTAPLPAREPIVVTPTIPAGPSTSGPGSGGSGPAWAKPRSGSSTWARPRSPGSTPNR